MFSESDLTLLERRALELGAKSSRTISVDSIVVEDRAVLKWIFGCGGYGSHVCPPYIPTVDEFRKMLSEYKLALLVEWGPEKAIPIHVGVFGLILTKSSSKELYKDV